MSTRPEKWEGRGAIPVSSVLLRSGEPWLYHYRARYYDANNGRFASEDSDRFRGGINCHDYVMNRPTVAIDPLGLWPQGWHYQTTYDLARAIFGPKCEQKAWLIATSNAGQDDTRGAWEFVTNVLGTGEGWNKGSIHFAGGATDQYLHSAFQKCDPSILGAALHGVQDNIAHSGAYGNPIVHWWTSFASLGTRLVAGKPIDPDYTATQDPALVNSATSATATILQNFKKKCFSCCE